MIGKLLVLIKPIAPALIVVPIGLLIVRWAARRYEREQQRLGRWDEKGPLYVSDPPPRQAKSYGMEERLEVVGLWQSPKRPRDE